MSAVEWSPGAAGPLLADVPDRSWQAAGRCAETDPEIFFPERGGSSAAARRVCMSCEVRALCLEYALGIDGVEGIWGGTSPRQRLRIKSARQRKELAA